MASQSLSSSSHIPGPKAPCDSKLKMVRSYDLTCGRHQGCWSYSGVFSRCVLGWEGVKKECSGPFLLSEHGNPGIEAGTITETAAVQEQDTGAVWRTQDAVCIDTALSWSPAFTEDGPLDSLLFPL